jgi:hypothetical protein
LEVNSEKTKYMLMSRKKAGQKNSIKIANRSFEGVGKPECKRPLGRPRHRWDQNRS